MLIKAKIKTKKQMVGDGRIGKETSLPGGWINGMEYLYGRTVILDSDGTDEYLVISSKGKNPSGELKSFWINKEDIENTFTYGRPVADYMDDCDEVKYDGDPAREQSEQIVAEDESIGIAEFPVLSQGAINVISNIMGDRNFLLVYEAENGYGEYAGVNSLFELIGATYTVINKLASDKVRNKVAY